MFPGVIIEANINYWTAEWVPNDKAREPGRGLLCSMEKPTSSFILSKYL